MNFFFGINNDIFKSEIQIPLFKNRSLKPSKLLLFKCYPKNNKWRLEKINNRKINDFFYSIAEEDIKNNEIYFLADENTLENFDYTKLKNLNSFTNTSPAFRSNFKIFLKEGGFSSYQAEYPYSMVSKKGNILSSISSIANIEADRNFILIKNIFEEPIEEIFNAYLVNYSSKKIEKSYQIKTNNISCVEIPRELIKPDIFLITDKYLGIPMYVSIKNNSLSFEHTHPPHQYIQSSNKYLKVSELKKEFNEIIN